MSDRLIDVGVVPKTQTEHKLIGRWPIDIGTAPKTQTDMEMTNQYGCDPENSN